MDLDKFKLDLNTAEGQNAATALAVFRVAQADVDISRRRLKDQEGLRIEIQWRKVSAFLGRLEAKGARVVLTLGYSDDPKTQHTIEAEVSNVAQRLKFSQDVRRVLKYMGLFRGEANRPSA